MNSTIYNTILKDAPLKQLSGTKTLFKKQLLRYGDWIDPIFPEEVMAWDRPGSARSIPVIRPTSVLTSVLVSARSAP